MHIKYENQIWPSFFYTSSYKMKENVFIKSYNLDSSKENEYKYFYGLEVDNTVTVVTF
jgi:hypothetical protein